jgi:hypothetical protein
LQANGVQRGPLCSRNTPATPLLHLSQRVAGGGLLMLRFAQCSLILIQITAHADGSSSPVSRLVGASELCTTTLLATGVLQALLEGCAYHLHERPDAACLLGATRGVCLGRLRAAFRSPPSRSAQAGGLAACIRH